MVNFTVEEMEGERVVSSASAGSPPSKQKLVWVGEGHRGVPVPVMRRHPRKPTGGQAKSNTA